jgi:SNF2 family DNA or RNA helicase
MTRLRQSALSFDLIPAAQLDEWRTAAAESEEARGAGVIRGQRAPTATAQLVVRVQGQAVATHSAAYQSSRTAAVVMECARIGRDHPGEKMIVFSEYAAMLVKVQAALAARVGWKAVLFLGTSNTPSKQRQAALHDFESDPATRAILMTYKAGGAGMNLQHANHIIEIDQPWTEATQHQAEGRAWRIGQTRLVSIYRFFAPDTFEAFVLDKQHAKHRAWREMRGLEMSQPEEEEEEEEEAREEEEEAGEGEDTGERGEQRNLIRDFFGIR